MIALALAAALSLMPPMPCAQPPGARGAIVAALASLGEKRVGWWFVDDKTVLELWIGRPSGERYLLGAPGTWTILRSHPRGLACLAAFGSAPVRPGRQS